MKTVEEWIAQLRADGVEDESIFEDIRNADAYVKAHPEEKHEGLMELAARLERERLERLKKKRRRTK